MSKLVLAASQALGLRVKKPLDASRPEVHAAQEELKEALFDVHDARAQLRSLKPNDLRFIASLVGPTLGTRMTVESFALLHRLHKKPHELNYSHFAREHFRQGAPVAVDLIAGFQKFDFDAVPQKVVHQLTEYVSYPDFTPDRLLVIGDALAALCAWIRAAHRRIVATQALRAMQ